MFERILVPLDGSEFGERSLQYAAVLAGADGGAVSLLSVLHTVDSPFASTSADTDVGWQEPWQVYLRGKTEVLAEAGVGDVSTVLRSGEPARVIAEVARELRADVIVMSSQGLGTDGSYGMGSIAMKVLMSAPCPVFMVRINKPEPPRSEDEARWQDEGGGNVG